jgi:hypothetical protein
MAEISKPAAKTRETKKGFRRLFIEVPEEQHKKLEEWAKKNDREGGANEAARVLFKRHFDMLISKGDNPLPLVGNPTE